MLCKFWASKRRLRGSKPTARVAPNRRGPRPTANRRGGKRRLRAGRGQAARVRVRAIQPVSGELYSKMAILNARPGFDTYVVELDRALYGVMSKDEFLACRRKPAPAAARNPLMQRGRRIADQAGLTGSQTDFERMLGTNDLVGVDYMARGVQASRSVGRILLRDAGRNLSGYATGFLVSPRLLLTNRHVLEDAEAARGSLVEFGYEFDGDGVTKQTEVYRLLPDEALLIGSSDDLDFALVAVALTAERTGTALSDWGFLRLDGQPGKVAEGEFVTIIQHPNGEHKQVALRENEIIKKSDQRPVLLYHSDTAPGSSGSPCFNDQWQVVALHSRAVPKKNDDGNVAIWGSSSGVPLSNLNNSNTALRNSDVQWEANLGVRVSAIVSAIASDSKSARNTLVSDMLQDIQLGGPPLAGGPPPTAGRSTAHRGGQRARLPDAVAPRLQPLADPSEVMSLGYDPDFLGTPVPLPSLGPKALTFGKVAIVRSTGSPELTYTHFSVYTNATRRMAFFTAVNIDGARSVKPKRLDNFRFDPRIPESEQAGNWLYQSNDLDRGHLVRRLDPCWGSKTEAEQANSDSNYYTNIAPQYKLFNQSQTLWAGLEEFILGNTDVEDIRASVLNGPVFRDDDQLHRGVPVPRDFWKVVVVQDRSGRLRSSAYTVSQETLIQDLPEEQLPVGKFLTFQHPVRDIEALTGLIFDQVALELPSASEP
ncbi:hypothetical protein WJX72_002576 [[Myrmecia] bisecta]|uniref:Serine protease n=1 Tax=[Myrmecia] bisecta TaxID=41462 RepID=A0AAW1Q9P9_9CHLO